MALAEILRCRYCGGKLLLHGGDYVKPTYQNGVGLLVAISYFCDEHSAHYQDQFAETGMKPPLHHEPMLKSDYIKKFIEVCLTENT